MPSSSQPSHQPWLAHITPGTMVSVTLAWARALPLGGEPTPADRQVLADLVHAEQRRDDQAIGVGFGDHASTQAASDATRHTDQPQ